MQTTETIVIGAGQAGLAASRHLTDAGRDHVVLERGRIGERWRSERWESLTLLTPNRLNRLPGANLAGSPDAYLDRDDFVTHLDAYALSFAAPVLEDVAVLGVEQAHGGFRVTTDAVSWQARNVVIATGDCDIPHLPAAAAAVPATVHQLHASAYRSAGALPPGGALVVGAGASGHQLALELARAGRAVTIAVGRHARIPRRYRGRDVWEWLQAIGDLDTTIDDVPDPVAARRAPSVALTGANGGEQLDLDVLHDAGVTVAGRLRGFSGRHALLDDLEPILADADRRLRRVLTKFDAHAASDPSWAGPAQPVPPVVLSPAPSTLDLRAAGIGTVIWATGYRRAYPWLHVPVLDEAGELRHRRGVTPVPGLFVLGLRFQYRRSSHFIGGVGADARFVAERIVGHAAVGHRREPARGRAVAHRHERLAGRR